jgi:hypothetical protein
LLLSEVAYRKKHGKVGRQQGLQWELGGLPSSFDGVVVILIWVTDRSFRIPWHLAQMYLGQNRISAKYVWSK